MRSHAVVIVRIVFQNPTQMLLAQDNDVVQTLAPDRSDQPFGKAVLPRRGRCNWLVSDTHGTQSARDDSAVDSISISDHIARSAIPRKSLGDLTCNPLRRRVGCDADPDEISAIKPDDDEAIQQLKANRPRCVQAEAVAPVPAGDQDDVFLEFEMERASLAFRVRALRFPILGHVRTSPGRISIDWPKSSVR